MNIFLKEMVKNILIIVGHPAGNSISDQIAEEYAAGAKKSGHQAEIIRLGRLRFDPILHDGYQKVQSLEPDLREVRAKIKSANHLVWVFPIWWFNLPAILKGFLDRLFLPGFAFAYHKTGRGHDRLLTSKTSSIIMTTGWPGLYYKLAGAAGGRALVGTLKFCGIKPVRQYIFGGLANFSEKKLRLILVKAKELGRRVS